MSSKIFVRIHAVLRKLYPMCPIAHVPYCPMCPIPQGPPSVSVVLTNIPFTHVTHWPCAPLAMCCIAHVSKRCQIVKKMSSFQKDVKCQKVKHIDFEGFWWPSYVMSKIDIKMCEPHYVNLFFLWTSSLVYVFDFLTFDIFLTIWHLFDNLTSFWHLF